MKKEELIILKRKLRKKMANNNGSKRIQRKLKKVVRVSQEKQVQQSKKEMSDKPVPARRDTNRSKVTFLELVFPPISNQEAVWLKDEPAAAYMKQSDFYMIGAKAKSHFEAYSFNEADMILSFDLFINGEKRSECSLSINELSAVNSSEHQKIGVGCGEWGINVFYEQDGEQYLLEYFSPETILWHRSREASGVYGLDNFEELFVYDLLYVGIAKKGDSYERLIRKGHQKRMEILANEPQRFPGARVSDETFLFLYKLEPLFITQFGANEDSFDLSFDYDHKRIVADAEKAFVNLLKPNYNSIQFTQYPKGADGLYDSKLDSYTYSLGEAITFNTPHGKFRGGRDQHLGGLSNKSDFISVDKESVKQFVAGEDFDRG
ncbi:hypothetical protein AB4456_24315 [Vibrio splendidus]